MNVPLICDCGSGVSKVGFAGTEVPLAIFPTILGKLRHDKLLVGMEEEDWFIGNEVQKNRGKLNLKYPISRAAITNWDNMEKIWHYSFHQVLHVAPEQHSLTLTEPPLNPMSNKEKVSQILFETFSVPALYLAIFPTWHMADFVMQELKLRDIYELERGHFDRDGEFKSVENS
ncbi:actin-1-like [Balaenoptera musculus]|uniref:Actin-1-like n=1 Tax=Balaenoptera musculus TaxID=9771 RepID=A0A8B8YCY4_BALMU|nr:actin-1-like [Balaenoptera musculus]